MAFATSNVKTMGLGGAWLTIGSWTGAQGDAAGTFTVQGGVVYEAKFSPNKASGGPGQTAPWSYTTSGGINTVTVANEDTVTAGKFYIIHA